MSGAAIEVAPRRPVLRWHGGKWKLAPRILPYLPPHHTYTETFGGAASILLRKSRSYAEVYNDLDDEVVTLFRVLRDDGLATKLIELLRLTPFARHEFQQAYEVCCDPVEVARRLIIRSFMGFGSDGATKSSVKTGFRATSSRSGTTPAHDWANYPDCLPALIARLRGVTIENRPAMDVMAQHDRAATVHFVDPPYMADTRSTKNGYHGYKHEMTDAQHAELLAFLPGLTGMVVLCGYPSALYDAALKGWRRIELPALADGARPRTEVLWLNPACVAALDAARAQPCLLAAAGGAA